jgi:hypothetical protein
MFEVEFWCNNRIVLRTYTPVVPLVGERIKIDSDWYEVGHRYWRAARNVTEDNLSAVLEMKEVKQMSDHVERQCTLCGSMLHHAYDCPTELNRLKPMPLPKSPYKETASISASYTASEPCSEVVLKLKATKNMITHKLILHEGEPGAVVIHKIETDHGGERRTAHPGLAKIAPFSVVKWYAELHSPIHDGPYLGRLDEGESLYFTVEFVKPSKFMVGVIGPQKRT